MTTVKTTREVDLVYKAIYQGYYWPKMFDDTKEYVKRCLQCQRFASSSHIPSGQHGPPHSAESLALHVVRA